MIHPGLLGKLPLGHLLCFELCPKPVVEGSAVLSRHVSLGTLLEPREMVRLTNYPVSVSEPVSLFGTGLRGPATVGDGESGGVRQGLGPSPGRSSP